MSATDISPFDLERLYQGASYERAALPRTAWALWVGTWLAGLGAAACLLWATFAALSLADIRVTLAAVVVMAVLVQIADSCGKRVVRIDWFPDHLLTPSPAAEADLHRWLAGWTDVILDEPDRLAPALINKGRPFTVRGRAPSGARKIIRFDPTGQTLLARVS